jgi:ACS family hexuronate transporter-like MFS transporter
VSSAADPARSRWLLLAVFVLSTAINYLDRATLATVAPVVKNEFHLSNADYGWIVNAFFVAYTLAAPLAGMLVDRIGLHAAAAFAVGLWSVAGIATGFTSGILGLAACRALLGLAEAGGIPAAGKAIHRYLAPAERGLGNALNQAAVSLGLVLAPPIATTIALRSGWRAAFIVTGALGLLWIPVWLRISRRDRADRLKSAVPASPIVRDRRVWIFAAANVLAMVPYSLWTNFTTLYFVDERKLTFEQAMWYAWIPPVLAATGGFAGGWLSLLWMRRGAKAVSARFRVCFMASVLSLAAAAIPAAPTVGWAAVGISISFFAAAAFSVNLYSLPLDTLGGAQAGFAISMLVSSAGAAALVSPYFGRLIDLHGYAPVTAIAAVTPLAASALLWITRAVR